MASIILSFVGQQDPFAKTETEGSIVTLVRHLVVTEHILKRVFLLHTDSTEQNAIDTRHWLLSEVSTLTPESIEIMPVSAAFSDDPVNLLLATQEAREAVDRAKKYQGLEDFLEFNASSGTPAMKTAWSVLQALGYASTRSHVWQVRNPKEMRSGQTQVFYSDVNIFKNQLDLAVIRQQIYDYNYSGALITLQESSLLSPVLHALLQYGYYRISMDFDRAFCSLSKVTPEIDPRWLQEIARLRQKAPEALLQEAYFNALIRLRTQQYADFLVGLFRLQEQVLSFLVQERLGLNVSQKPAQMAQSWQVIQQTDQGKLYQFLQDYILPKGGHLHCDRPVNRYVLQAIVEYYPQFSSIVPLIKELNQYCDLRNEAVHGFVGVSELEDQSALLNTLRKLMKQITKIPDQNPFDSLNDALLDQLQSGHSLANQSLA
jgi:hypothetical protein